MNNEKSNIVNPSCDISDTIKAIMKIEEAIDEKVQLWLRENDSKAEAYLKGYTTALFDIKWYLENIDKNTSSII